jgi:adenylate cyclase
MDDRGQMNQESDNLFQYLESLIDRDIDPVKYQESIWKRYGKTVSVMVLDSSGFSRVSEKYGILHFLSRLMLMRRVVKPIIEQNGSIEFHFKADNVYAVFEHPDQAINTALACHQVIFDNDLMITEVEQFQVCIGIGFGPMLYSETLEGYYGEEMNLASKLGEDTADGGETLITEGAYAAASDDVVSLFQRRDANVSGVAFPYYRRQFKGLNE